MPRPTPVDWPKAPVFGALNEFVEYINGQTEYHLYKVALHTRSKIKWEGGLATGAGVVLGATHFAALPLIMKFTSTVFQIRDRKEQKIEAAEHAARTTYELALRILSFIHLNGNVIVTFTQAEKIWSGKVESISGLGQMVAGKKRQSIGAPRRPRSSNAHGGGGAVNSQQGNGHEDAEAHFEIGEHLTFDPATGEFGFGLSASFGVGGGFSATEPVLGMSIQELCENSGDEGEFSSEDDEKDGDEDDEDDEDDAGGFEDADSS